MSYIEGKRDHPVNRGVLCAKGAAGLMQVTSPARLRGPLLRVGDRGEGRFREISWDEALELAASWLRPLRETAPERFAFFTGRDQSQSFTGWWAQMFGTPNWAAHGGFCSVNMAAAGIMTVGSAFWEFGAPDWDRCGIFLLFGVAEDHDSNPIKIGIGRLKARGVRVVGVNPIRTGYNAVADDWFASTPGTDGLFVLALVHCLLEAGKVDLPFLARFTNAPHLVGPDGLILKNAESQPFVIDRRTGAPAPWDGPGVEPDLGAVHQGCRTVFAHLAGRYLAPDRAPEAVADRCGIPRRASGRWPPNSRAWPSRPPAWWTSPGPISAATATPAGWAARWRSMPCAAYRPMPTASRRRARSTCCRRSSERWRRRGPGGWSRPIPSRWRHTPRPMPWPCRAGHCRGRTSGFPAAPTSWRWTPPADRCASTRPSPGKTRSRPTA